MAYPGVNGLLCDTCTISLFKPRTPNPFQAPPCVHGHDRPEQAGPLECRGGHRPSGQRDQIDGQYRRDGMLQPAPGEGPESYSSYASNFSFVTCLSWNYGSEPGIERVAFYQEATGKLLGSCSGARLGACSNTTRDRCGTATIHTFLNNTAS